MALWLVRAGSYGQYEDKFLEENKIFLTWDGLNKNLGVVPDKADLRLLLEGVYPGENRNRLLNHSNQIWTFSHTIAIGDWVVLPSKHKPVINIAEVTGKYVYTKDAVDPFFHYRNVKWIATDIPRSNFDQDILYSFGAFLTVCRIQRNDAEARIKEMAKCEWKATSISTITTAKDVEPDENEIGPIDLEQNGKDQIAKMIMARFKGYNMQRLVAAILTAKGFTTFVPPEGADKGVDILASPGALGFGQPRLCVQVKSGDTPLDRPTLDQLVGTMQNFSADQGLLVSWGGFKTSVEREEAAQFFRVRLWNQDDLIKQILENYDKLADDIRAELPLKRIWTVANPEQ